MRNGNADDIAKLIEPGRVHRDVYTDPDIFELEMERIFGRAWLFVGHASQVPQAGDFVTTELGRQPVVMTRHRDGHVHVLLNRCTHRGAMIVVNETGIYISNGQGATITLTGPAVDINLGALTVV